ncbi:MAG: hypothetical protein HYW69_01515 [Candidatus Nealsonbacteria bacterium]|nr:hypothetical protein [Candidatus Nealsonbacteria bacterium]
MKPKSLYHTIIILSIVGLVLPNFILAQEAPAAAPQTLDEAGSFTLGILNRLPEAIKKVWNEEALPVWLKMWDWAKPVIDPWRQKFLGLLGKEVEKRRPDIEKQFREERQEMQKDLWERFKDLIW